MGSTTNFGNGWLAIESTSSTQVISPTSAYYNSRIIYNDPTSATINTPIKYFTGTSTTGSNGNTLTFAVNQGTLNWAGPITEDTYSGVYGTTTSGTNTYQVHLTKVGSGMLVLSGDNNFADPPPAGRPTGRHLHRRTARLGNWIFGSFMPINGTVDLANRYAVRSAILTMGAGGAVIFDNSVAGSVFTLGGLAGLGTLPLQDTLGNPITLESGFSGTVPEWAGVLSVPVRSA